MLMPSFHLSFPNAKAVRSALAAGAVAGLVVIAACTDGGTASKALTAPPGPRTETTSTGVLGHGAVGGLAGTILVCIDASAVPGPVGTYTLSNSFWNSNQPIGGGPVDEGDGGEGWFPENGTTVWTPAKFDGNPYSVIPGPGNCKLIVDRQQPSAHYNSVSFGYGPDHLDDFQSVRISVAGMPSNAAYDHTDCVGDIGVPDPQPTPCGNTNQTTKAFANYDHGTKVTFVFTAGATSTGIIAPTATTCQDCRDGKADTEPGIFVGFKGLVINNAAPGVFFYYAHVNTTGMGTQTIGFTQGVSSPVANLTYKYAVQQGQAYLYNQSCQVVATFPLNTDGTVSSGISMPAANYILGIKFATDNARGKTVSTTATTPLATHSYATTVGGSSLGTSTASINTNKK